MDNYKEKYERARAKALKLRVQNPFDTVGQMVEHIFPELAESEEEKIKKEIIAIFKGEISYTSEEDAKRYITWLEKQGEHQQLYIRFGDIPANEKSKIYSGEQEIGSENGVSVYPAFKSTNGSIILGLNLPITKTTLHTQQYLLEYDNRPCYLVTGDYIGKDTDGQILISNVNIIEKIDNYIVKTEKQCEQKETLCDKCRKTQPSHSCQDITALGRCAVEHEQKSDNKVEPKFRKSDWIVHRGTENIYQVVAVIDNQYQLKYGDVYTLQNCADVDRCARLYDVVKDARDGDVLFAENFDNIGGCVFIFKGLDSWKFDAEGDRAIATGYCCVSITESGNTYFGIQGPDCVEIERVHPATKEQRDTLFTKMKEAGYEWDAEKKELKKTEDEIEIPFSAKDSELQEATYFIPKGFHAEIDDDKVVIKKGEKLAEWSGEDEEMLTWLCRIVHSQRLGEEITLKEEMELGKWMDKWLNHNPQPHREWGEEDKARIKQLLGWLDTLKNYIHYDALVSLDLRRERIDKVSKLESWLKSFKQRIGQGLNPNDVIEWLRYHIQVDEPKIEYNEDGQPLAESFIAHAEARCMAADKVIERFKKDFKL